MPLARLFGHNPLVRVLLLPVAFTLAGLPASAQSVVSTHAGVIHYFEGNVYLGDQALEAHLGRFPSVAEGGELRTAEGRAEVLLTPGVFLRMADRSAIRMVATELADTRVELEAGSLTIDAGEPNLHTSVTVIYKDWSVRVLQKGVYRMDSDPPRLSVREGRAEVFSGTNIGTNAGAGSAGHVFVEKGMNLPFARVLVPEPAAELSSDATNHNLSKGDESKNGKEDKDPLDDWDKGRNESIAADNAITAQLDQDPGAQTDGSGFTDFPLIGVPPAAGAGAYSSAGLSSAGLYNGYAPYQPGFYSIYLPGYTYRPFIVGLMGLGSGGLGTMGIRVPGYVPFSSIVHPGVIIVPRVPVGRPMGNPGAMRPPAPVIHIASHR